LADITVKPSNSKDKGDAKKDAKGSATAGGEDTATSAVKKGAQAAGLL
jgi:hypothetical protein